MKKWLGIENFRKTFILIGPSLKKHWLAYLGLTIIMILDLILTLAFATVFGQITDAAIHGDMTRLLQLTLTGLAVIISAVSIRFLETFLQASAVYSVKRDLKLNLFRHTLLLRADSMTKMRSGDILSRFDHDMKQIEQILGTCLLNLLRYPLIYCCVFIYLFQINPVLALVSCCIAPVAIAGSSVFGFMMRRNSRQINNLSGDNSQTVSEALHGYQVIRSFLLQRSLFNQYTAENQKLFCLELKNAKIQGLYYAGGETASRLTFFACLALGAYFISRNQMSVGALMTFTTLVSYLVFPLTGAAGNWAAFQRAAGAVERVQAILNLPLEAPKLPPDGIKPLPSAPQGIQFDHVSFSYKPGQPVLNQFTLTVRPGKKTAIVGFSGAGKTTLFSLLLGFYQPQGGKICINGEAVSDIGLFHLRQRMAHVPQEPTLFNGTIRENLLLGRKKSSEEVEEATHVAAIDDFISSLPARYETQIGERGLILSGGQKQRLAIARALLKDAPILLLDEATSALDSETEEKVKDALDHLMAGRTTLIIAHRLTTICNADHIVVMDHGRIVQEGTHQALIRQTGLYRRLYKEGFEMRSGTEKVPEMKPGDSPATSV